MLNLKKAKKLLDEKLSNPSKDLILLLDDEAPNLRQLAMILSEEYQVITANDGEEGLEMLKTPGIAVIISDYRMPKKNGIEFCKEALRQQHPASRIILTGYAEIQNVVNAINEAGVFRYLTKPIVEEVLFTALRQAVAHYRTNQRNLLLLPRLKQILETYTQSAPQTEEPEPSPKSLLFALNELISQHESS